MHPISVTRFWQMVRIEEERAPLMDGMMRLIHAYQHLKNNLPSSDETALALDQMSSLIGPMEDENKSLSQTSGDLWRAILETDGPELSSREIEKRLAEVATGISWLGRAMRHVENSWSVEEGRVEILMELAELRGQLHQEVGNLRESQRVYQWNRAEALAQRAIGDAN